VVKAKRKGVGHGSLPGGSSRVFRGQRFRLAVVYGDPTVHVAVKGMAEGTRLLAKLSATEWEKLADAAGYQPGMLALLCGVRMRWLQRFFQCRFGESPTNWMRKLRCRQAASLIAEGWGLKSAGPELGFASASHLCHEFKKAFGVSPRRFAREVRVVNESG
jgi:AraC-like DNA-binding protein